MKRLFLMEKFDLSDTLCCQHLHNLGKMSNSHLQTSATKTWFPDFKVCYPKDSILVSFKSTLNPKTIQIISSFQKLQHWSINLIFTLLFTCSVIHIYFESLLVFCSFVHVSFCSFMSCVWNKSYWGKQQTPTLK